jgi:hypothetical protein
MSQPSITNYVSKLIGGLKSRNIQFILSEDALGCKITEIYVTEAHELIMFLRDQLDTTSLQWVLQIRTPLQVRITIFSAEVSKLKIQLLTAINKLKQDGLEIPESEHVISVQDLTETNILHLLTSLENWFNQKSNMEPLPLSEASLASSQYQKNENSGSHDQKQKELNLHLQNAIKTYWTERYFARYLNLPSQKVAELAERIGIQHEICGQDILYFFNRKKALETYFEHIIKGILDELKLKYHKTSANEFFLPALHLTLLFFDGEKDGLRSVAGESTKNPGLIVIVSEALRRNIGLIQDAFFQVLPLDQDKIKIALIRIVRQRVDYIPAYSSGITN